MTLGELATIRRYSYWSDRRVRSIAEDNEINLDRRLNLSFRSPAFGLLPQAEVTRERKTAQRHEVAQRLEGAIGQLAVETFATPPRAAFVKGCGRVTIAAYTRWYPEKKSERKGIIAHTRVVGDNGCHIEVCLFGSIENCGDYLSAKGVEAPMWSSSSTWCIDEFITNGGTKPAPIYDDDESIAVEVVHVFNNEGMTGQYAFKKLENAEWFAEVYHDVVLDKGRWNLTPGVDIPEPIDRIVIGAPLWIRSNASYP